MLLRGLPVYWLYWLNLRQYTLNLYSKGELCRFSINKSPALRTLCGPVSIQVCQCGTWKLWGRWSIWTNNSAIIDSLIRKQVLKVQVLYWVNFTTHSVCYSTFQKYYIVWNISNFLFPIFYLTLHILYCIMFIKTLEIFQNSWHCKNLDKNFPSTHHSS